MIKDKSMSTNLYFRELHEAVVTQLRSIKRDNFIEPNKDYATLFAHLGRKYVGALDQDTARDLIQDAFIRVFCINLKQNFSKFNGEYMGETRTLWGYVSNLFARALINLGKEHTRKSSKEVDATDSEGNDMTDYMSEGGVANKRLGTLKTDIDYIDDKINYLNGRLNTKVSETMFKKINAEIDRLQKRKEVLLNGAVKTTNWDDGVYDVEEEREFDTLKDNVIATLKKHNKYSEKTMVVLELLCEGYTPTEITKYLRTNAKDVKHSMDDLKEGLVDYAVDMDEHFRLCLLQETDNGNDFESHFSSRSLVSNLEQSVENVFGINVVEML